MQIININNTKTGEQFKKVLTECRTLFEKKPRDYSTSRRILRPSSLTDQLFIKAGRIRSLEIKKQAVIDEGIRSRFMTLINHGIVGLIQLEKRFVDEIGISAEQAMALYDQHTSEALTLMVKKNHDYDEAWRPMRVNSYTDFVLTKIQQIRGLEDIHGQILVSESIDSDSMDIIGYAVFGIIRLSE